MVSHAKRRWCGAALFCLLGHVASAADVRLTGDLDDDLKEDLEAASLLIAAERDDVTAPQDLVAAARADYGQLLTELYREGYYGGVISIRVDGQEAADISPLVVPGRIERVRINVEPGPRFRFGDVGIAPLPPNTQPVEDFSRGQPAQATIVRQAARDGVRNWRQIGRAKARVADQSVVADHTRSLLNARIILEPGPLVRFGDLRISGNERVRTERVRQIAGLPTGEVFSPDAVDRVATRLRRAGAFRSVVVEEAETLGPDQSLDIALTLVEERPRRFGFGAEVSSLEGVRLTGFWLHRNLLGGAERLRIEGEVAGIGGDTGGIDYRFATRFTRPATFRPDVSLYALGEIARLDEPDFTSNQINLELGLTALLSDELEVSAGVGFRFSDVEDAVGDRQFTHLTLPASVRWDRRNNDLDPTGGTFTELELLPFIGLDGSASGGRLTGDGRVYFGFGEEDRFVLAGRGLVGLVGGADIDEVPPDLLFYSGGGGTVRGQPYQSLSVELDGESIGGRAFLGLAGEVRAGVTERIGLVGFYDAGYVGADDFSDGEWHAGAGLGLRYDTGIGPIRLDVAAPVDGDTGEGVQIYVGIGQAF